MKNLDIIFANAKADPRDSNLTSTMCSCMHQVPLAEEGAAGALGGLIFRIAHLTDPQALRFAQILRDLAVVIEGAQA